MLLIYFLSKPILWVLPWILQAIAYFFILKKMDLRRATCLIPFLAERQMSKKLFRRLRSFYRPFIISVVLVLAGYYLDPAEGMGRMFMYVALIVYGVFLLRLYWRLAKSFHKGRIFYIGLILLPPLFLLILGVGKAQYLPLQLKPVKDHGKVGNTLRRGALVLISAAEIAVLVLGVGFIAVFNLPPSLMVAWESAKVDESTKDIVADFDVVSREDMMGKAVSSLEKMKPSREKFFPDHSQDQNTVVLTYIVGSNLEKRMGLASANIRQMVKATEQGENLTFVVEAGGSKRWFTDEMKDTVCGRYEIKNGKITELEQLPDDTCMSEEKTLEDFLKWAKKKYKADRHMLVLWDHGGGVPYGYGQDDLNKGGSDLGTITTSQVIKAIDKSGIRFDLVGFDACLMQDIEIASAMEPYADYYLASEETEGGYGWYYTDAFGALAQNPGMTTEEFGKRIISTYDQLNTILKDDDGNPDTGATLSLVDTTMAKPACDKVGELFARVESAVREDSGAYASIAAAGTSAYNFSDNLQIDLIDFLRVMSKSDYDDRICSDKEVRKVIRTVQSCVLFRNKDSAEGINGMAFAFPYQAIGSYGDTSSQLKKLSMKEEREAFDVIFSIMAAQQMKAQKEAEKSEDQNPMNLLDQILTSDYTQQEWYVKGFEDYDTSRALVDIPLKETAEGYEIQAPEKIWDIIMDAQTMLYQNDEGSGNMIYLGRDQVGGEDAEGHPLVSIDGNWVHIGGQVVCYEAEPVKETENGDVYSGKVRARLNDEEDIVLTVEWDPVQEGDEIGEGKITGYEPDSDDILAGILNYRQDQNLKAGDTIQFIFDTYDGEGNLVKSAPAGDKVRVSKQGRLKVEDAPIEASTISIGGVLTDIYQRTMTTELVELQMQ